MANFTFETETIDYLIDKVAKSGITKLKLKSDDFEIEIEAQKEKETVVTTVAAPSAAAPIAPVTAANTAVPTEAAPELSGNVVKSPIIGTFYASPSPDKAPYVSVGQTVQKGDVLFIVESMKLMNEIKSEYSGKVAQILVQNGDSVDYNQPIMVIE
ncbi:MULTISPECIES: acetyl-CoA carboxylase biotin carboxyl carrier protein [Clostridiaceae]|uniref:Biotin carboxyl carrier protein of acetyl-CoA carboxylase n=1 Tax=Clostridium facile TaxID=2763035 RepID=A0ABR7ITA7_9CLOT|nr:MULTISPECIES: acetyl-CoA carboxylase biotin carboxyl carrier protein [Clostridiaceae]MBC5788313.1 acetyl-CoA carboxylase biotin carboxyl carrier protein [Clostridium facile]PWN00590.1 MAG: acetyl-CoA carboxylase biotin carboxyl carrier protein [Massilioclostridium sp.]